MRKNRLWSRSAGWVVWLQRRPCCCAKPHACALQQQPRAQIQPILSPPSFHGIERLSATTSALGCQPHRGLLRQLKHSKQASTVNLHKAPRNQTEAFNFLRKHTKWQHNSDDGSAGIISCSRPEPQIADQAKPPPTHKGTTAAMHTQFCQDKANATILTATHHVRRASWQQLRRALFQFVDCARTLQPTQCTKQHLAWH